jgi:hypothetical protein
MTERFVVALAAMSAALAACSGDGSGVAQPGQPSNAAGSNNTGGSISAGSGGTPSPGSGGTTPAGAGGTGGTSGAPSGGTAGSSATGGSTCVPGVPTTSQIPRLLKRQYDAVMQHLLGVTTLATADNKPPSAGLYADYDGPMNVDALRLYHEVAEKVTAEVLAGPNRSKFIACDPAAAGCLTETIRAFGRKAFRRPLTDAEVARFEKLGEVTPARSPEELAETTLFAFLVSPSFLQLTELTTEAEGSAIKLSSYEVAARLSFVLWGSVPDDELNAAADRGELQTKDQILAQAQRMIAVREKTAPLVAAYHRAYLDMDNEDSHWWKTSHDAAKFPSYSDAARPVLQAELDRFFEELAFGGGSFQDLFLSNVAFVTKDTAAIYGLDPAAYGTELTRVDLDQKERPGFLTRAGFLSSFSHFDATSPILRGAYITVNIIGLNPGAPDPNFFLTPAPPGAYPTERAYVEALTSQPTCTGCHTPYINPPGFVLENYDATGKWQTVDPRSSADPTAGAINPTATVTFSEGEAKMIGSPLELMQGIAATPLARRIYATKAVSFTTGRLPNPNDTCTVELIDMKLSQGGYTMLNLLADLTQADSFRLRVREN